MMSPDEITTRIQKAIPGAVVELTDLTGTSDHYQATITAAAFESKSPVEQHRMVYAALGDAMAGPIHALTLKTQSS